MKRTDYCLHIKGHSGDGIEREKYILIGELVDVNARYFLRDCQNINVKRALTNELFSLYGYLEHIELYSVDIIPENQRYNLNGFIDKNLQQSIEILRTKYNAFVRFNERDDMPERALLIGDEVIPIMPPIPDECIKVFLGRFDSARIQKNNDREYYSSNEHCSIVLYDNLSIEQQLAYSDYGSYLFFQQNNLEYLDEVLVNVEDWAQKDFERKLKTSSFQSTASALIPGDSPTIPAVVASVPFPGDSPAVPASAPVADAPDVIPDVIPDYSSFVSSVASRERVTSKTVEVKPAPDTQAEILRELKTQSQQGKQQTEILQQSLEVLQQSLEVQRQNHRPCKIDSLDKIPDLDLDSGEWLIASEYARTRKPPITVKTLKQGRSNVKKNHGNTQGLIAEDESCGIHGKHVWRFGGYDNNNNEIYYYYIYGVDGKYTP